MDSDDGGQEDLAETAGLRNRLDQSGTAVADRSIWQPRTSRRCRMRRLYSCRRQVECLGSSAEVAMDVFPVLLRRPRLQFSALKFRGLVPRAGSKNGT